MVDWQRLRAGLSGTVSVPGAADWNDVHRPRAARFAGVTPLAVVRCADAEDVAATLRFTRAHDLPLVIRGGGHDFAGRSTSTGVVLHTGGMDGIRIAGDTVTVGAGALLGQLYRELDSHGLAIPGGCGATVGVAGLALGGGLGILGRHHGLTCDSLLSATVVLADGRRVVCDEQRDAELFWALRGAGACSFGVVTELVFRSLPAPDCEVFELTWPAGDAGSVLAAWQAWAPDAPRELAASLLLNCPAEPDRPLRVTVFGAAHDLGPRATRDLLGEFVALVGSNPAGTRQRSASWFDAKTLLTAWAPGAEQGESHDYSSSEFHARSFPPDTVDALIDALRRDRVRGEARELDFSPWGGAYNVPAVDATAFPHRRARFLLKHGAAVRDAQRPPGPWLGESWRLAHPHGTGGVYPNFPDPGLADPARAYFGPNLPRLTRVTRDYDPEGVFPAPGTTAPADR